MLNANDAAATDRLTDLTAAKILFAQTAKGQGVLTDNDKALVERLRAKVDVGSSLLDGLPVNPDGPEAADRIEAQAAEIAELKSWKAAEEAHHHKLRAEIERLRAALVQIARLRTDLSGDFSLGSHQSDIVRAALGETE